MARIQRVRTTLTGMPGGPGVSTMYFLDASAALDTVKNTWIVLAGLMPAGITFKVENTGDVIEATTGDLVESWAGAAQASFPGGDAAAYAAPAGAVITWLTPVIVDSHRLKGRTFVVPLTQNAYQNDGSLTSNAITTLEQAGTGMIASQSANFVIWHRPFPGAPAVGTKPARPAFVGSFGLVTAFKVKDSIAVLRSRRD